MTRTALRGGGWANVFFAVAHVIGLAFAWTFFRWTSIEPEMRELSDTNAAFPYLLTLVVAGVFGVCAVYAFSGAGDVRALPLVRPVLALVAVGYLVRGLAGVPDGIAAGGVRAVADGDVREIVFSVVATAVGLCYAYGAWRLDETRVSAPRAA